MAQQTVVKRSAAAAAQNTDTVVMTPAAGAKIKVLAFHIVNETAAQSGGMSFELRFGSNAIAVLGLDIAAAPIGQTSKQAILAHEFIGDGVTTLVVRNLVALAASSVACYVVVYDSGY